MELQEAIDFLNENVDPEDNPINRSKISDEEIIREADNLMEAMEAFFHPQQLPCWIDSEDF